MGVLDEHAEPMAALVLFSGKIDLITLNATLFHFSACYFFNILLFFIIQVKKPVHHKMSSVGSLILEGGIPWWSYMKLLNPP